ncbi:MAG TPA: glycosyltransferase family 39 protein [Vicinamibacterales bacterium]|nr:glycosyltransferase family 39 protein [Vicinamibacterales bacterium]
MRKTTPGVIIIVALLTTLAAYAHTLRFGFRYDDYHVLRPATTAELLQVLHGSWDPTQIESAFYRPLTAWWYALRFELFGLNAVAQHAVSLAGMILCAGLVGLFVRRETESDRAALFATGLYAVHPTLAYSQSVWLTNQMHLIASLVVLLALLAWQGARTRSAIAWWPIAMLQIVGFGVKEDLVMLAPLLLVLSAVRRLMRRDVPWPPWPVTALGLAFPVGLFALRYEMLGRLGGYGPLPAFDRAWTNFSTGLVRVFRQLPAKRPWEPFVSAFAQALVAAGTVLGLLRRREAHLLVTGVVLAIAFDAPFVFISKAEQYHLIALGAVLALTGAVEVLVSLVPARALKIALASALALAFVPFVPLTRNIADDFAPCSAITLHTDDIVVDWWVVPTEIRSWLRGKAAACAAGTLTPLPRALRRATWGYGVETDEQGRPFEWTSERGLIMVPRGTTSVTIEIRRTNASDQAPATVRVHSGGSSETLTLTSAEWRTATVPISATMGSWLGRMNSVGIDVSPPFIPAEVDAANPDRRHLGVQLRWVDVK